MSASIFVKVEIPYAPTHLAKGHSRLTFLTVELALTIRHCVCVCGCMWGGPWCAATAAVHGLVSSASSMIVAPP